MNVKFHKNCAYTGKILKISCVRCSSVILDVSNSRAPMRNVFLVLLHMIYYIQGRTWLQVNKHGLTSDSDGMI